MNIILFSGGTVPRELPLGDERARHIVKVLKLGEGDTFKCGLVNGPSGICRIEAVTREALLLSWEEREKMKQLYPVTLLVGYTRPVSSKRILREAVSLGAERIYVTGTDTGEKSYRISNLWKTGTYKRYLTDGAQQAGATAVPEIRFFPSVAAALDILPPEEEQNRLLMDHIHPSARLSAWTPAAPSTVLAVGSERGWSAGERVRFEAAGFLPVSLGNRILRTETAVSAGLAVLLSRMGYL